MDVRVDVFVVVAVAAAAAVAVVVINCSPEYTSEVAILTALREFLWPSKDPQKPNIAIANRTMAR